MNQLNKQFKPIPDFKNEVEEREFWQTADPSKYFDLTKMRRARFPNLRLSTSPITIRIPDSYLDRIKIRAQQMDIPYQSLINDLLAGEMKKAS